MRDLAFWDPVTSAWVAEAGDFLLWAGASSRSLSAPDVGRADRAVDGAGVGSACLPGSVDRVHPIERLRYVARASGADQAVLVRETAQALAAFRDDPSGLVAACRRIVDRHPTSAPLWWLCARVLTSPDGQREAWAAVDEIEDDRTAARAGLRPPGGGHRLRDRLARAGGGGAAAAR